jgi:hypothetical protein
MMNARSTLREATFAIVGLTVCALPAKAEAEACPLRLPATALQLSTTPESFTPLLKKHGLTLSAVGMLHGPYDGSGYLKPTVTKVRRVGGKETFTATWDFGPPPHYQRWYFCEYGEVVELFRQVDVRAESCTIVSTREGSAITAMRIACTPAGPHRR